MKRYIAFLDILGFKDLVENNSLDDVVRIYKESLKEATELAMEHWEEEEYKNDGLKLNVSIMSDSILFWNNPLFCESINFNYFLFPVLFIKWITIERRN